MASKRWNQCVMLSYDIDVNINMDLSNKALSQDIRSKWEQTSRNFKEAMSQLQSLAPPVIPLVGNRRPIYMHGEVLLFSIESLLSDVYLRNIETIYNTEPRDPRIIPPLIDLKKQRMALGQVTSMSQYITSSNHYYYTNVPTNVPSVMDLLERCLTQPDTLVETVVRYLHENHEKALSESVSLSEELPVDVRERLEEYSTARLRYREYFTPLVYRYNSKIVE